MSGGDLERAWHEASNEMPPHDLDEAIIAAARNSAPDRVERPVRHPDRVQSRNWLAQWQSLAAAAAVAGLAFVLVQTLPRERDLELPVRRQESSPAAPAEESPPAGSPARAATDAILPSTANKSSTAGERVAAPRESMAQGAASAPAAVPAPSTGAPASAVAEGLHGNPAEYAGEINNEPRKAVAPQRTDRTMDLSAATQSTSASSAAPASTSAASTAPVAASVAGTAAREADIGNAAALDASARAAKIAALHETGNLAAAAQALREFRSIEPRADMYLPDSLRDWAATVH